MKTILSTIVILFSFSANGEEISVDTDSDLNALLLSAEAGEDVLVFEPGVYRLNIELTKNVDLKGRDATNTVLISADGTSPTIKIDSINNTSISNFTFRDSQLAIQILDSSTNIDIINNIFHNNTVAVESGSSAQISIENNTFYNNESGIAGPDPEGNLQVYQNIFQANTEPLVRLTIFNINYNCFRGSLKNVTGTDNKFQQIAIFADQDNGDFHLTPDSDCINGGESFLDYDSSVSDLGAYGGGNADLIPNAVTIIEDGVTLADNTVTISWNENLDYRVAGYKVYYSLNELKGINSFLDRKPGSIVQTDANDNLSLTVTDLDINTVTPDTPVLLNVSPRDRKLLIDWKKSANASSYTLHYRAQDGENKTVPDVANDVSSYTLTDLNNETIYDVWIVAHYQKKYHFQVAAYLDSSTKDSYRESSFIREDTTLNIGKVTDSLDSKIISAKPERIVAYPDLPAEGCFIATAAFGFYSADEVQTLRDFRDQYLLKSKPGVVFVRWYYEHSPTAAAFINKHDFLKPVVRAALYPLIISAQLLEISILLLILILLTIVASSVIALHSIINNPKKAPI